MGHGGRGGGGGGGCGEATIKNLSMNVKSNNFSIQTKAIVTSIGLLANIQPSFSFTIATQGIAENRIQQARRIPTAIPHFEFKITEIKQEKLSNKNSTTNSNVSFRNLR